MSRDWTRQMISSGSGCSLSDASRVPERVNESAVYAMTGLASSASRYATSAMSGVERRWMPGLSAGSE
eukprot:5536418-Prymnesium_polylepis.1